MKSIGIIGGIKEQKRAFIKFFKLGPFGERLAIRYLIKNGYWICKANWRTRIGEIDIIAGKNRVLYFFEVKTRRSSVQSIYPGRDAIISAKIKRVKRLIGIFVDEERAVVRRGRIKGIKFNLIEITVRDSILGRYLLPAKVRFLEVF